MKELEKPEDKYQYRTETVLSQQLFQDSQEKELCCIILKELISKYLNVSLHSQSNRGYYVDDDDDEENEYHKNDDTIRRVTSTEEEAKLLMNLSLSPVLSSSYLHSDNKSSAKKSDNAANDIDDEYFHVNCPSLSLVPTKHSTKSPSKATAQSILRTPLTCQRRSEIAKLSNTLLNNIGSAFTFSLQTRLQSWMDSLKRVMQLRYNNTSSTDELTEEDDNEVTSSISSCENSIDSNNITCRESIVLDALSQVQTHLCTTIMQSRIQILDNNKEEDKEEEPAKKRAKTVHFCDAANTRTFPIELHVLVRCNLKSCHEMHQEARYITISTPGSITAKYSNNPGEKLIVTGVDIDFNIKTFIQSLLEESRFIIRQYTEDFMFLMDKEQEEDSNNAGYSSPTCSTSSIDSIMMPPPLPATKFNKNEKRNNRYFSIISPPPSSPTSMLSPNHITPKAENTTIKSHHYDNSALVSPPLQYNEPTQHTINTNTMDLLSSCIQKNNYPSFPTLDEIQASKELFNLRQRSYTGSTTSSGSTASSEIENLVT